MSCPLGFADYSIKNHRRQRQFLRPLSVFVILWKARVDRWVRDMRKLHPQIEAVLKAQAAAGLRPIAALTPVEARAQMEETARARKAEPLPVGRVDERMIPGPGGPIRLRLYWPQAGEPGRFIPAIVYYHGGGHVIGSLDTHDFVARNLCAGVEALVASVDYRMGPEHKFPAAVEDSFAALEWVHANARSLGTDSDRLGVHGDSAGANLAAVVALMARDAGQPRLRLQSLVYPVTDYTMSMPSYDKFATGYGILTGDAMRWFRNHYLGRPEDAEDWHASPLKAPNLKGAAPAILITAECDVLHDEGEHYADALRKAGVAVEYREFAGMIHAFFGMVPLVDDAMNAQRAVWAAFKRAFGNN
jgi:acetyl esterase/lipase